MNVFDICKESSCGVMGEELIEGNGIKRQLESEGGSGEQALGRRTGSEGHPDRP